MTPKYLRNMFVVLLTAVFTVYFLHSILNSTPTTLALGTPNETIHNEYRTILMDIEDRTKEIDEEKLLLSYKERRDDGGIRVYDGPIEHIFFHPLIAYPEIAFDGDGRDQSMKDWFVTVDEFDKILDSLYKNNYILIDIHTAYEKRIENGKTVIVKKKLLLPKGKKPLIISIDDLNYYYYMRMNGTAYKIILDDNGNIATYSRTPEGKENISYSNAIIPILDSFVKKHPDFSLYGAKGIIAFTGYYGILGYRTDRANISSDEETKVKAIIARLKDNGWTFASHGYAHLKAPQVSYNDFVHDTDQWKNEVEKYTGPTDLYIYPFGSRVAPGDPKFDYLLSSGFNYLFSVGNTYLSSGPNYVMMSRRHIDGIAFHSQAERLRGLFNVEDVIDPARLNKSTQQDK